jgi:hypothetical protein
MNAVDATEHYETSAHGKARLAVHQLRCTDKKR